MGAAACHRRAAALRCRGGDSPEKAESGATEPGLGHGLAQKDERGVRDTTGPKPGLGRCLSGVGFNGGGLARRNTPASGVPALDWA